MEFAYTSVQQWLCNRAYGGHRVVARIGWSKQVGHLKWLFFVPETTITAICGESLSHHGLLPGFGVLELNQNCTIRDNFRTVVPQVDLDNIDNEFIFPHLSNVSINVMAHEKNDSKKLLYFKTNFSHLEKQLQELHSKTLNTSNLSYDVQQRTISYVALGLLVIIIVWFYVKIRIRHPIPAPRMHMPPQGRLAGRAHIISIPNLNCA